MSRLFALVSVILSYGASDRRSILVGCGASARLDPNTFVV
jgi:hypothetical protein